MVSVSSGSLVVERQQSHPLRQLALSKGSPQQGARALEHEEGSPVMWFRTGVGL